MSYSGAAQTKHAREILGQALAALQLDPHVPESAAAVASFMAQAVGSLFLAENAPNDSSGRASVRAALGLLGQSLAQMQQVQPPTPAIDTSMGILAQAMGLLFPLTIGHENSVMAQLPLAPPEPAPAPVQAAPVQPAPVQAAPAPVQAAPAPQPAPQAQPFVAQPEPASRKQTLVFAEIPAPVVSITTHEIAPQPEPAQPAAQVQPTFAQAPQPEAHQAPAHVQPVAHQAFGQQPAAQAQPVFGQQPAQAQPAFGQQPATQVQPTFGQQPAVQAQPDPAHVQPAAQVQPAFGAQPATQVQPAFGQQPAAQAQPAPAQQPAAQVAPAAVAWSEVVAPQPAPAAHEVPAALKPAPEPVVAKALEPAPAPEPAKPVVAPAKVEAPYKAPAPVDTSNRRLLEANIGLGTEANFWVGFEDEIAAGGVFMTTYEDLAPGTRVMVQITLPQGSGFQSPAKVRFVRDSSELDPSLEPGLGLQFEALAPDHRDVARQFLARRKPLFYDVG